MGRSPPSVARRKWAGRGSLDLLTLCDGSDRASQNVESRLNLASGRSLHSDLSNRRATAMAAIDGRRDGFILISRTMRAGSSPERETCRPSLQSNAGLLNPLFQATQLGGGTDRGTRVATRTTRRYCGTWILQMDAAKSGRDLRGVRGKGDPHTPTSTPTPHVPANLSEKDQGKKKYGSATLRGQSSFPAPVTAAHPQRRDLWPFPFSG
jgi:hypothetical protein